MFDLISKRRREMLAALEGLISPEVGEKLSLLASTVPTPYAIVELGSYRGKSACYLAEGSLLGFRAPVFCVDPWDMKGNTTGRFGFADPRTREAFNAQVASMGHDERVTAFRAFSHDFAQHWTRPIGLLYVDGSHTEHDVSEDVRLWLPHVAAGGMIAFDDYRTERNPGVARVVDRLRRDPRFVVWEEGPAPLVVGWLRA